MAGRGTAPPPSLGNSRDRICELVDAFERCILALKADDVYRVVQAFRSELSRSADEKDDPNKKREKDEIVLLCLECGVLQCLERALIQASKADRILEAVLEAIIALGTRQHLANGGHVSVGLLLGFSGISAVVKIAEEHRDKLKIRDLVLRVFENIAAEEQGARMLVAADGCRTVVEYLSRFTSERGLAVSGLNILSQCCLLRLNARAWLLGSSIHSSIGDPSARVDQSKTPNLPMVSPPKPPLPTAATPGSRAKADGTPSPVAVLLKTGSTFKANAEVLEPLLCILCLLACSKYGARYLNLYSTSPAASPGAGNAFSQPDAIRLANSALSEFAVRSFQASVEASVPEAPMGLVDMPFNVLKSGLQRLTTTTSSSPGPSVVTHQERHCCAWALMLLHNLAIEVADPDVRASLVTILEKHAGDESRQLHSRLRKRIQILKMQGSENEQESDEVSLEANNPVDAAAAKPDDSFAEGPALEILLSLEYLNRRGFTIADFQMIITDVAFRIANELQAKSVTLTPLPLSVQSARLISTIMTMCSHPHVRERLNEPAFALMSESVLSVLQSGDPPEYFNLISRALREAMGNREPRLPFVPRRSLPLVVTTLSTAPGSSAPPPPATPLPLYSASDSGLVSSSKGGTPTTTPVKAKTPGSAATTPAGTSLVTQSRLGLSAAKTPASSTWPGREPIPDAALEFNLYELRRFPDELCRQMTLMMEQLYGLINPCLLLVGDGDLQSAHENVARFVRFHSSLVLFLQREILDRKDLRERVALVECIIYIADVAAQDALSNADLTMACLEALEGLPVRRLAETWHNVSAEQTKRLRNLKVLTQFDAVMQDDVSEVKPSRLLIQPRLPYLQGCLRALKGLSTLPRNASLLECARMRYEILAHWLPQTSPKKDWHGSPHVFAPNPAIQMHLADMHKSAAANGQASSSEVLAMSHAAEPQWAIALFTSEAALRMHVRIARTIEEARKRLPFSGTPSAEQLGADCRSASRQLLLEMEEVSRLEHGEETLRENVERAIVLPHLARLMLESIEVTREQETGLAAKCTTIGERGIDGLGELLGVPSSLRLPYRAAQGCLRMWATHTSDLVPTAVLKLILDTKNAIFEEAGAHGAKDLTADDLIPIMASIVVMARAVSLCAGCHLLHSFFGDDLASGEAAYYLITLESAIQLISHVQ